MPRRPAGFPVLWKLAWLLCGLLVITSPSGRGAETAHPKGKQEKGKQDSAPAQPSDNLERLRFAKAPEDLKRGGKRAFLTLYENARALEEKGDRAGALAGYLEILEAEDFTVEVAERAAMLLIGNGDKERALGILEKTVEALPDAPEALLTLARFCAIFGRGDKALEHRALAVAHEAVQKFPASTEAVSQVVAILRSRGDLSAARDFLDTTARASAHAGKAARRMLAIAQEAQKIWPVNQSATREENLQHLNSFYEDALDLAGGETAVLISVGEYFVHSGQYERALEIYTTITSSRPELVKQRLRLADIRNTLGEEDGYLADLESLLVEDPDNPAVHKALSEVSREKNDAQKTVFHLAKFVELAPGRLEDHLQLARLYQAADDHNLAVATLDQTLTRFPHAVEAYYLRAMAKGRLGKYADALSDFESAESMGQDDARVSLNDTFYFEFGVALERSENVDEAAVKFLKALSLVAEDDSATTARISNYFGYMWLENNLSIDRAGQLIKKANVLSPDTAAYLDSLGWFYLVQGDFEKAEQELERAWELLLIECQEAGVEPIEPDAIILEHTAKAKAALGKYTEAIKTLHKALELAPENQAALAFLKELEAKENAPSKEDAPAPLN